MAAVADLRRELAAREQLAASARDQQAQWLRYRFDTARRDLENQQLVAEQQPRNRQVAALLTARRWQWTALALGGVLLLVFAALIIRQIVRLRDLRVLASTDALTGLANRRSIERAGATAIVRARTEAAPLVALTFDIDHFKRVNDTYGHPIGDEVLRRVARACPHGLRQRDMVGRTGGEEFLVLLPDTRLTDALPVGERVRAAVAATAFNDLAPGLATTISIGLAELRPEDADLAALVTRADLALYRAKGGGRNRVEAE